MSKPNVIVLGAGPNGLTAAAYLARAGCNVSVVEKNVETGGGLVTEELCGFKMNFHATYLMLAELMPPYADLDLRERGVRFIRPAEQAAFLFAKQQSFTLYTDPAKSVASVARLSPDDAPRVAQLLDDCRQMCEAFLVPATYVPALEPIEQVEALNTADEIGRRCGQLGDYSPLEFLESYGIKDERVKGGLLYLLAMFGLDPTEGGMGFLAPIYLYRLTQAALVAGGSHQLSSALRRAVEEYGGAVLVNNAATGFIVENGRVVGVQLADGRQLRGDAVISTLNPEQTFVSLFGGKPATAELGEVATNWEWEKWSLFVTNIGAVTAPPRYEGYPPEVDRALVVVMGYETAVDVLNHIEEVKRGDITRIAGHATVTSLHDPLQAPRHVPFGECHTLRWESFAPFDRNWDNEREAYGKRCFEFWRSYAPNLRRANVRTWVDWSPLDIEGHLATMKRGSIKHGSYTTLQMGYNRPSPDCSGYRTPISGLYLGGASVHPGGMVILGPGYNAAGVVAHDLGVKKWWSEPSMVTAARAKGYLGRPL